MSSPIQASDNTTTVGELKEAVRAFVRERDWEQFHSPKNLSMALAAESGELMEHFLWLNGNASRELMADSEKRQAVEEELADVLLFALGFANSSGIDLVQAIYRKMQLNADKYPVEKARGSALKYDQF